MVVQCDYCITLDRIPEDFYPDIVANQAQHDEWVKLFAIDETEGDTVTAPYANPLTVEFLKTNPFLVLDTKFFGREWKYKLQGSLYRWLNPEIITGDHSTPCAMKSHSWHPVPVLLHAKTCRPDEATSFGERACLRGGLGVRFPAYELLPLALAHAGRLDKFGA